MICTACLASCTVCFTCLTVLNLVGIFVSNILLLVRAIQDKSWVYGGLLIFVVVCDLIRPTNRKEAGPMYWCRYVIGGISNLVVILVLLLADVHPDESEKWMDIFIIATRVSLIILATILGILIICTGCAAVVETTIAEEVNNFEDEKSNEQTEVEMPLVEKNGKPAPPDEERGEAEGEKVAE